MNVVFYVVATLLVGAAFTNLSISDDGFKWLVLAWLSLLAGLLV